MPFISIEDGVGIGSVGGERAIRLYGVSGDDPGLTITFVEDENGNRVVAFPGSDDVFKMLEFRFTATQLRALGMFCVRQFMGGDPHELLSRIELSAKGVATSLEAWNERARSDEEHPPYETLVRELALIKDALDELRKGLKP